MSNESPNSANLPMLKKESVNLNTLIAIVGILSMFAGFIATWTLVQYKQGRTLVWQESHEQSHRTLDLDRASRYATFNSQISELILKVNGFAQMEYRLAQLEKAQDATEERIGRMAETYTTRFSEIRSTLGTITTQQALANEALKRIEAVEKRTERAGSLK